MIARGAQLKRWRWSCAVALVLLALGLPARAANGDDSHRYARQFANAARAYDDNRLAEAIAGWPLAGAAGTT